MAFHFGVANPYLGPVEAQLNTVERLNHMNDDSGLRRRPDVIGAEEMRRQLNSKSSGSPDGVVRRWRAS